MWDTLIENYSIQGKIQRADKEEGLMKMPLQARAERGRGIVGPNPEETLGFDRYGLLHGWTNLGETFRD